MAHFTEGAPYGYISVVRQFPQLTWASWLDTFTCTMINTKVRQKESLKEPNVQQTKKNTAAQVQNNSTYQESNLRMKRHKSQAGSINNSRTKKDKKQFPFYPNPNPTIFFFWISMSSAFSWEKTKQKECSHNAYTTSKKKPLDLGQIPYKHISKWNSSRSCYTNFYCSLLPNVTKHQADKKLKVKQWEHSA